MLETSPLEGAEGRIAACRTAEARIRVVDGAGRALPGVPVQVAQVRHAFLFGCNVFPVLGYADAGMEAAYQHGFCTLLNYATLPFYWAGYEKEPGVTRQARLEEQAQWCRAHGIRGKGHPLVWHEGYPTWAPSDADEARALLQARVTQIVSHFAGLIDTWDVVNEATVSHNFDNGVGHWAQRDGAASLVSEALGWAYAANPRATLLYNDYNLGADYEALAGELVATQQPVAVFGLQSHMHTGEWPLSRVWEVCETYARFGKPLHFTELTVLSGEHGWEKGAPWPSTPEGEARQADYVEQLYTLLFSHPAVEAITSWDFMDGGWMGAPAGLVRADLTPKPAYERLLQLVKDRWWTSLAQETDAEGTLAFRGYLGDYRVSADAGGGRVEAEFTLARGVENTLALTVR